MSRAHAQSYIDLGLRIVPTSSDKRPRMGGFGANTPAFSASASDFRTRDGIAIICGPCPALGATDGDPTDGDWLLCLDLDGGLTRKRAAEALDCALPVTLATHEGAHLWYRVPPSPDRDALRAWNGLLGVRRTHSGAGKAPDVDVKWAGGYAREVGGPDVFLVDEIAELPREALRALLAAPGATRAAHTGPAIDLPAPSAELDPAKADALVAALISEWPASGGGRHDASKALGGALRTVGASRRDTERVAWAVLSGGGCSDSPGLRLKGALDAWDRLERGEPAYGMGKLKELLVDDGKASLAALRALQAPWKPSGWEAQAIAEALSVGASWGASAVAAGLGPERHISSALEPKDIRSAASELKGRKRITDKTLLRNLAGGAAEITRADAAPMAAALARAFPQHTPDALAAALVAGGLDPRIASAAIDAALAKTDAPRVEAPAGKVVALNEETGARRPEHVVNAEARACLLALPEVYVRAGGVCEVHGSAIVPVRGGVLRDRLTRACSFARWSEGEGAENYLQYHQPPPDHVVSALDGEHYGTEGGRQLAAVLRAPTLAEDGSVIVAPGYDDASGLYLPGECTAEDWAPLPIAEARQALETLVGDFPYEGPQDRAVALAALLTVAARPLLWRLGESVPAFLVDAGDGGAGKTLLAHVVRAAAGCSEVTDLTWNDSPEEMGKLIDAHLFEGAPIMILDNVATGRTVRLHALTSYLTATRSVAARQLGRSEKRHVAWLTTIVATGCNVQLADELSRRFLRCRLVSGTREYHMSPSELQAHAVEYATYYQCAALSLLSEHIRSRRGQGEIAAPMPSYEGWQRLVAECVREHFGLDPCLSRADLAGLDEEREAIGETLDALAGDFKTWTDARGLVATASPQLRVALEAFLMTVLPPSWHQELSALTLGKALGAQKDRPAGAWVVRMRRFTSGRRWKIEPR